jgi:hypothetical protein
MNTKVISYSRTGNNEDLARSLAASLPAEPAPRRRDTMAYRISRSEVESLTGTVAAAFRRQPDVRGE